MTVSLCGRLFLPHFSSAIGNSVLSIADSMAKSDGMMCDVVVKILHEILISIDMQ